MKKVRVAVIGLDHVHTKEMIEAFTKNPDTDLVGIAEYHDCTEEELQFHLRRHTPEGIEPEVYRDYKELLKQNLDIAVVCTGVNDHADIVEETLALGINTIIEKPMNIKDLLKYNFEPNALKLCLATENVDTQYLTDLKIEKLPTYIAIGPEKGWSSSDIEVFKNLDFTFVKLKGNILRTETAGLVIGSIVKYIKGEI